MLFSSACMLSVQFAGEFNAYGGIRFAIFVLLLMCKVTPQNRHLDDWVGSKEADS